MQKYNKERFNFLGLNFHRCNFSQAQEQLEDFIASKKPHMVFTPTAELVVLAEGDNGLKSIYNNTDLLLIDSYVLYYAARLLGKPVKEPVNAARLMFAFLETVQKEKYRVYLLGSKEELLLKAVANLKFKYPGINIVGFHHGYFDFENDTEVVADIRAKGPDILFVAMSSPLKENFVARNLGEMGVPVCMGVGGSVDVLSGDKRMAPLWISKIGMEWFYRLIQDPRRLWKRYSVVNMKFLWLFIKEFFKERS